jgi:hypothetical protein
MPVDRYFKKLVIIRIASVPVEASNWPLLMASSTARAGVDVVESRPLIRTRSVTVAGRVSSYRWQPHRRGLYQTPIAS